MRRNIADVKEHASEEELLYEVRQRGFHLIETGNQFVVICNKGVLKIHC